MRSIIPLFSTSGHLCPGSYSQNGFQHLHDLPHDTCSKFPRFTSKPIPADLLVDTKVAETFHP